MFSVARASFEREMREEPRAWPARRARESMRGRSGAAAAAARERMA